MKTLAQIVGDSDNTIRIAACEALGKIGPAAKEAIPALQAAIRKNTSAQAVRIALRMIDPAKFK